MSVRIVSIALLAALSANTALAGVYTDDLSKCLVEATTTGDRTALVKWMFTAASAHPAITSLSTVTSEDRDAANQVIGALFMKLMTESCREKTQKALKYEGPATLQLSFQVLGQVAGAELFSNPEVAKGMAGLEKFIDSKKLAALKEQ